MLTVLCIVVLVTLLLAFLAAGMYLVSEGGLLGFIFALHYFDVAGVIIETIIRLIADSLSQQ